MRANRAIPLADAPALGRAARRTSIVRILLALALVALVGLAALVARKPGDSAAGLLPGGASTTVVLDMSASVSDLVYREIARTLESLVVAGERSSPPGRIGLVLFSDAAQEALPPGTPAGELVPFIRFFRPKEDRSTRPRPSYYRPAGPAATAPTQYPFSPWFTNFSGGTAISKGLNAARLALRRDGIDGGRVLLVSDLADRQEDLPSLTRELVAYSRLGIELDIVALPPAGEAQKQLFRRILGGGAAIVDSAVLGDRGARGGSGLGLPLALLALVVLAGLAVAAHELLVAPLAWRRRTT